FYELNAKTLSNVPYAVNDSFQMVDSAGNELTYAVMGREILPAESRACKCCALETRDQLDVHVNKALLPDGLRFTLLQDGLEGNETEAYLTVCVETSCFLMKVDTSGYLRAESPTTATVHNSLAIGSHTYLNVVELHRSVSDSAMADAIWYSTQEGLLRYRKLNGEIWSLP
ncbi:MAG TPA: hypothetical protein VHS96_13080, partial [Bacteroidia bacterium]|nr:hypothetical protein [Bacteroidia bacterium]